MSRTAKIIDGKKIAEAIRAEVKADVEALAKRGVTPGLVDIMVGDDPATAVYVRMKERASHAAGMAFFGHQLPARTTERRLLNLIAKMNEDPRVHGILVQLPLPGHIDEKHVINAIDPEKDADGFHPVNVGRMLIGERAPLPCTPHGIQRMLIESGYRPAGKHVVIVGRSNIVGKPMAAILMQKAEGANATVTVCHSRTKRLASITKQADILIVAIGSPRFVKARMVKEGAVVVDVGMHRVADATKKSGFRLVGDVDFEGVRKKAKAITPVPGGVGPLTVAMLLRNTVDAALNSLTKR